jgi:DNA repair exonuclease SbcCD nuclease subunit
MRILCTADIHIGRRAARVPPSLLDARFSCAAAWDALVRLAIDRRVDAVLLSGDLVDRANWFFEAYGPLERGLRTLARAGVRSFAVAGNHDFDVLPRLVEALGPENFRLLGRAGQWERFTLEADGRPRLHLDGWSFPAESVRTCPLDTYRPAPDGGAPTIGLLHADVDQPRSTFGPVALAQLQAQPVALWLMGHIHRPARYDRAAGPTVLYPGSPQAMDPGETGAHGAWVLEVDASGVRGLEFVPLSVVRYDTVEVDATGAADEDGLQALVARAVADRLDAAVAEGGPLAFLCCRLRLVGRTALHRRLAACLASICDDLELPHARAGAVARVDKVEIATRPPVDLEALARGSDAAGNLARVVLALQGDSLASDGPDLGELVGRGQQSLLLLDTLLAQKEPA